MVLQHDSRETSMPNASEFPILVVPFHFPPGSDRRGGGAEPMPAAGA